MIFEPRTGVVVGGRFVLQEIVGSGGMGEVYCALDQESGERVAIKLLHAGAEAHVERFLREAKLLAALEHQSIVRYVAHGHEPAIFLAMEWLEGEDLSQRLARSPLELRPALALARRVAEALHAAHERGIVHRDVKPSNVFLCGGRIDEAKILDFGIARLLEPTRAVTMTGQVVGTLGYMAPEQARETREVDSSVDVFSLGCVLFECLTSRPAFPGDSLMAVLAKILFAETPRVSDLREGVPAALDDLVARMLQKQPADRPTTTAIIAELDAIAALPNLEELRPRARALEPDEVAISAQEQRVMCVVLAAEEGSVIGHTSPTVSVQQVRDAARELTTAVEPFGGRVELLANGSRLVILSGMGAATDRAAQAARCALVLREMLPGARMALTMGPGDPTAEVRLGVLVGRAEELAERASVERIRIDQTVAGLLDPRFAVSGDRDGLELVAERPHGDPRRLLLGKPTPFVGRARELAMLTGAIEESCSEPVASAMIVTAPPGWGKTRLAHELVLELTHARGGQIAVWTARADPIAAGSSFGMLAELLRGVAGLLEGEPPEVWQHKLSARVARHVPAAEVPRVTEFLGEIVGARFPEDGRTSLRAARSDGALMGDQMLRAWEDFVVAECSAEPVLVLLEDLHWGDLPTVRFIDAALRILAARPFIVVALGRPELTDRFPGLWQERRVQELRLRELTPRASRQLVAEVLGEELDRATVDRLVDRAGGNAFYLEELIRAVAENRGDVLPDTIVAMAQARLERLPAAARRVLRAASVFGQAFWEGGVATLIDQPRDAVGSIVDDLERREFVGKNPRSRFHEEDELSFRHVIVRDAAYGMLTERDRVRGHELAAAWLEGAGERDALVMAEHHERGGQPKGAVVWFLWAAEQAFEGHDMAAVFERAERGIACGATGAVLGELRLLQAESLGWGANSEEHARLARKALLLSPPGSGAYARAAAELAVSSCRLGDFAELDLAARSLIDVSLEPPGAMTPAHVLASARTVNELLIAGRADHAEALVEAVEAARPMHDDDRPVIDATQRWLRAARALFAGRPEPLASEGPALVAAYEACGQPRHAIAVELHRAMALMALGADAEAVELAEQTLERAEPLGLVTHAEAARLLTVLPLVRLGRLDEAEAVAARCREVCVAARDLVSEARARASLAAIGLLRGHDEDSERAAREVLERESFPPEVRAAAAATLARLLVARGNGFEAVLTAGRGIELLRGGSVMGDGELRLVRIEALLAAGAAEEARRSLEEAAELVCSRAAAIRDPVWRASFLNRAEHREILARTSPA
jgi:eukaryotic-like serine/threonine-protein kinase